MKIKTTTLIELQKFMNGYPWCKFSHISVGVSDSIVIVAERKLWAKIFLSKYGTKRETLRDLHSLVNHPVRLHII